MTNVLERPFREEFPGKKNTLYLGIAQIGRRGGAAQMDFDTLNCVQGEGVNLGNAQKKGRLFSGKYLISYLSNSTKSSSTNSETAMLSKSQKC